MIEIESKMRNGKGNGIKNDNRNSKPLPKSIYLTELDTVVR